jgi:nicotinamide-nucleotide amidase
VRLCKCLSFAESEGANAAAVGEGRIHSKSEWNWCVEAAGSDFVNLLAVPGASAYFLDGAVVYTLQSRRALLDLPDSAFAGLRGLTEELALVLARGARQRFATTWSISEVGAAGPTGSRYGDPPGTSCIAVAGPVERALIVRTGNPDRVANMKAFTAKALELLSECLRLDTSS